MRIAAKQLALIQCLSLLVAWQGTSAQTTLRERDNRSGVEIGALYQSREWESSTYTQVGLPVEMLFSLSRSFSVGLQSAVFRTELEDIRDITTVSDLQLQLTYAPSELKNRLTLALWSNLPGGLYDLDEEELNTALLMSQRLLDFAYPGFGQGLQLRPSVLGAYELLSDLVVGGGISYNVRAPYSVISRGEEEYSPGNELTVTGGLEIGLGRLQSLSGDVSVTVYGADKFDGQPFFDPGTRFSAIVRFLTRSRSRELSLAGIFSDHENGEFTTNRFVLRTGQESVPNATAFVVSYSERLSPRLQLQADVRGQRLGSAATLTLTSGELRVIDALTVIAPEVRLEGQLLGRVKLVFILGGMFGDVTGFDGGVRISARGE